MTRTRWIVAVVAGLAIAGAGGALAASRFQSPSERSQAIINDAAGQLNIAPSKLTDALRKAIDNQIDAAVTAGDLTKDQGDELKKRVDSGQVPLLGGFGLRPFGFGFGPPNGALPSFGFGPPVIARSFSTAADYLGLTTDQLRTELQSGKTLAQIATEHGKTASGLVDALVAATKQRLDTLVTNGKLSSDDEAKVLAATKSMLTDMVNGKRAQLLPGGKGWSRIGPRPNGFGLGPFLPFREHSQRHPAGLGLA
jgi:hypothetical protein